MLLLFSRDGVNEAEGNVFRVVADEIVVVVVVVTAGVRFSKATTA